MASKTIDILINIFVKRAVNSIKKVTSNLQSFGKSMFKVSRVARRMQGAMVGAALGFLFMGMALKRLFETILFSTIGFFQKVVEGQSESSAMINQLTAAWDLLKLSIGEAIAEFLLTSGIGEMILNIVRDVVDWIDQNNELVAIFVLIGTVVGTLMLAFGQIFIFIVGIVGAVIALLGGVGFVMGGVGLIAAGVILIKLAIVGIIVGFLIFVALISALILIWAAWETDFQGFRDVVKRTFKVVWSVIKGVFKNMWNIAKAVFGLVTSLMKGDFGKAFEYIVIIFLNVVAIITKIMAAGLHLMISYWMFFGGILYDIISELGKAFIEILFKPVTLFLDGLVAVAREIGKAIGDTGLANLKLPSHELNRFLGELQAGTKKFALGIGKGTQDILEKSLETDLVADISKLLGIGSTGGLFSTVPGTETAISGATIPGTANETKVTNINGDLHFNVENPTDFEAIMDKLQEGARFGYETVAGGLPT